MNFLLFVSFLTTSKLFRIPRSVVLCVAPSVPQMLAMMVDLEEDDEWAMADELEDDDFDR